MRKLFAPVPFLCLMLALSTLTAAQSRARRVGQAAPPPAAPSAPAASIRPAAPRRGADDVRQREANEEVSDDEVVRVNTTLVSLPVSIMDRDGRFIPNLRKEDFRIFEDGVEQEVAYFATVEKPFTVALVLDTSGSTHFKMEDIQEAAIAFIDQLRPEDRVIVVSFDDQIRIHSEVTSDRRALASAIRRTHTGGGTKLYDAVDFVIKHFDHIQGRKAIVLFTDGVDTTSKRATYASNVRDAEELDALIYPVQYDTYEDQQSTNGGGGWPGGSWPGGRWPGGGRSSRLPNILGLPLPFPIPGGGGGGGGTGSSRDEYRTAGRYLREMAETTGGRLYRADDRRYLEQSFSDIAEELRRQYSLGYYPSKQTQAAERRQVKVRVKRPNLVVRARDSYIYRPSGANAAAVQDGAPARPASPPELRRPHPFARHTEDDGTMLRR